MPILALSDIPNDAGNFVLGTNAGDLAIEAVQSIQSSRGKVATANVSHALYPTERKRSTTRKELFR